MSNQTKRTFTEGPWEVHEATSSRLGFDIQTVGGDELIAFNLRNAANARLIAAAPELLEALIECRKCINHYGIQGDPASFMADTAIAKATGVTS
jgi:hypothetical protein